MTGYEVSAGSACDESPAAESRG